MTTGGGASGFPLKGPFPEDLWDGEIPKGHRGAPSLPLPEEIPTRQREHSRSQSRLQKE
jgi:hypothetical protein